MSSVLHNTAALSALQALTMTQQSLAVVENQVSTGLAVATAADNSSYWSIATSLNSDSGIVTASQSALSEGQSVLSTATSAINSVITTLNSMATALTAAQNPGAVLGDINTSVASLGAQLTDTVNSASFNGLNILNGSQTAMNFVSGFNASATGGSVTTIAFTAQALSGAASQPTTTTSTINSAQTITALQGLTAAAAAPTVGTDQIIFSAGAAAPETLTVNSIDATGNTTSTVYTALDATGTVINGNAFATDANIKSLAVSTTYTPFVKPTTTTTTSTLTDPTTMTQLQAVEAANVGQTTAAKVSITAPTATYGADAYYYNAATQAFTIQSQGLDGTYTTSTYTALDSFGNSVATGDATLTFAKAASYAVTSTVTANPQNLLVQGGTDITQMGATPVTAVSATNAKALLASVNQALAAVTNYAA